MKNKKRNLHYFFCSFFVSSAICAVICTFLFLICLTWQRMQYASFGKSNAKPIEFTENGLRILESSNLEKLDATLFNLIAEVMPVFVSDLCWLVSTDETGKQYLSIFNNEGNTRTHEHGDVIDHAADRVVDVSFKNPTDIKVIKEGNFSSEITKTSETTYKIKVPATGFIILAF